MALSPVLLPRSSTPWMTWNSSSFKGPPRPVDSLKRPGQTHTALHMTEYGVGQEQQTPEVLFFEGAT
jgi:hypothetical protein